MLGTGIRFFSFRRPPGLCCHQIWRKDAPSGLPAPAGCPTLAARWLWPPAPGLPEDSTNMSTVTSTGHTSKNEENYRLNASLADLCSLQHLLCLLLGVADKHFTDLIGNQQSVVVEHH